MNTEAQVSEKELLVELDGYKIRLLLRAGILAECEKIKASAKVLLEEIKTSINDEKEADIRVREFLKDSIKCLLGDGAATEVFNKEPPEITNLTAVLCSLISSIGMDLGSEEYGV